MNLNEYIVTVSRVETFTLTIWARDEIEAVLFAREGDLHGDELSDTARLIGSPIATGVSVPD